MIDLKERLAQVHSQAIEREETAKRLAQHKLNRLKENTDNICDLLKHQLENTDVPSNSFYCNIDKRKAFLCTMEYSIGMHYGFELTPYEKPFIEDAFLTHMRENILAKLFSEIKDVIEIQLRGVDLLRHIDVAIIIKDNKEFFNRVEAKKLYPKWIEFIKKGYKRSLGFLHTSDSTELANHDDLNKASDEAFLCVNRFINFILDQFDLSSYLEIMSSEYSPVSHHFIQDLNYKNLVHTLNADIDVDNKIILDSFILKLLELTQAQLDKAQDTSLCMIYDDYNQSLNVYYRT
jgi:hypothetical protein